MIDKVADLSHQLREVGLPVSVRSTQSAAQIYRELGEDDRNLLKTALRAIYVKDKYDIPMWHRPTISIAEASAYSGIGTGKLYEMTDTEDCPFVLWVGTRRVIKRKPFVEYLERQYSI